MIRALMRALLWVADLIALLAAGALALLVVILFSSQLTVLTGVAPRAVALTGAMPAPLAMLWALPSPLGGTFRTDFFLLVVLCLVLARLFRAARKALS